jgi:hypothetical protein
MLLLDKLHISYFVYGTALLNAPVIAKVILIREAIHAGTKCDTVTFDNTHPHRTTLRLRTSFIAKG